MKSVMLVELLKLDQDKNHCEENHCLGGEGDEPSQVVDVHGTFFYKTVKNNNTFFAASGFSGATCHHHQGRAALPRRRPNVSPWFR
jgi:hypothetical protein